MQLLSTTPLAAALLAGLLVLGPDRGLWLVVLTLPLGSAAALAAPGAGSLALADFAILALGLAMLLRMTPARHVAPPDRAALPLALLLLWATLGALFLPRLLAGATEVYAFTRRDGAPAITAMALQPVAANITQLVRLAIGALAFLLCARLGRHPGAAPRAHRAMLAATLLNLALALADLGSHALGRPDLLSPLRTATMHMLDGQTVLGVKRLAGGFPEPAAFSYFTIGLFGYWLRLCIARPGALPVLMAAVTAALLLRSTATSAYLGLAAVALLAGLRHGPAVLRSRRGAERAAMVAVLLPALAFAAALVWQAMPRLGALADHVLWSKLASASGVERMSWNAQAWRNLLETGGLGTGIGGVRASSWLLACLGSLGLVGTALYGWFAASVLTRRPAGAARDGPAPQVAAALQAGCLAVLVQAMLTRPYPNLGIAFFVMAGLAVGLLRRPATARSRRVELLPQTATAP